MSTTFRDRRGRPRVVVTGMGAVTPCGLDVATTWAAVKEGRSGIGPITRFDATAFDTRFAGEVRGFDPEKFIDPKEARRMDRFIHLALAATEMAVADAGLGIPVPNGERTAVIVGAGLGGLETIEKNHTIVKEKGPRRISPFFIPALIVNLAPGYISIRLGAKGPNWSPVSACATSAHALGEAAELIRRGGADVVIAGGSEATITPLGIGGFNAMKALSTRNDDPTKASRPWDEDRDGFVMSEGAGMLVLESLEHAEARSATILAELSGYGATSDAYHITAPDGSGARAAMRHAIADAGLSVDDIGYVNAHGTSTPVGDVQELEAIKAVFGDHAHRMPVSSTKSVHGHLLGAAGSVEAIVSILAMREGFVPPTINLERPSPGCDLDLVPHRGRAHGFRAFLSNSFGFGGTNVSLVFGRRGDV